MSVYINQQLAVHCGSGHVLLTKDVCFTGNSWQPVIYQNIAKAEAVANVARSVFCRQNGLSHKKSYFSDSVGDEAGNHKGMYSLTTQGKAEFKTASKDVFIEGIAAVRGGDMMTSNDGNTPPAPLS